ncbi:MAG: fucose isomerase, partial [Sciscionella sp.]
RQSTFEWPHAFARLDAPAESFLSRFGANHIHAIPGDHVDVLHTIAGLMEIDVEDLAQDTAAR